MNGMVIDSCCAYLSRLLTRLSDGHIMTWEEAAHVERTINVCGFVVDVTALEATVIMVVMMLLVGLAFYTFGHSVGTNKGRNECDNEWMKSIEKEHERLKKYGFGYRESSDRAAVRTYKDIVEKRTRNN